LATDPVLESHRTCTRVYGQSEVLHGLNFSVAQGEIAVVVGRNGMGKSTLMKALIGMLPVKSGRIELDGTDVAHFKSYQRVAKGIAFVPQGRMIFANMTVQENIETGLFAHDTHPFRTTSTHCSRCCGK